MKEAKYIRGAVSASFPMEIVAPSNPDGATDSMALVDTAAMAAFARAGGTATPVAADRFTFDGKEYEVGEPLPGFSCWGYSKPDKRQMRIHATQVT